jgi:hypothetical protein
VFRNIGEVDKVSGRAVVGASFGSFAVSGTKPHRVVVGASRRWTVMMGSSI